MTASAVTFTDADLAANQRGLISDSQLQQLKRQQSLFSAVIVFLAATSVVIAVIGITVGQMVGPWFMAFMIVFAVVEFAALYTLINRFRQQFATDIEQRRVERYEGEVKRLSYNKRRGGMTAINVGEYQFYADRATFRALSSGDKVRAYVTPVSKTLLSYERVD
jgi:hypothetical protein